MKTPSEQLGHQWFRVEDPGQESGTVFRVTMLTQEYGKWRLGYSWVDVTLGGSRPVTGLALYARKEDQEPDRYVCFSIKEVMCFWQRNKVPPKKAAAALAEALANGPAEEVKRYLP